MISLAWSNLVKSERLWEKKKHEGSWTLDGRTLHFFNFHENKVTSEFFVHTRKSCNNTCSRVGLISWSEKIITIVRCFFWSNIEINYRSDLKVFSFFIYKHLETGLKISLKFWFITRCQRHYPINTEFSPLQFFGQWDISSISFLFAKLKTCSK